MLAYSYIADGDGEAWVFAGTRHGQAVYGLADAFASVDAGDFRPYLSTEHEIDRDHSIVSRGPEVFPVHTPERDAEEARIAAYERAHPFVNIP